ncbi:hypothetical protein BT96DRAFT_995957 [Gymnopus androsaceus JB14]|uniref:DNA-directed RNA polymerase n=1 Tax=Gymnopus androsaceus JB14 TaxID=1447944 RepID=A0A6A4HK37_9AGAR|nr:hypothetical protein BT96DRAFT_995957 [Gymnopus androsaceus JB14]
MIELELTSPLNESQLIVVDCDITNDCDLAPVKRVKEVRFGILSPEEIKAYSVAKIEHPEVMDESTHKPKMGGLMDPRLGTIDREEIVDERALGTSNHHLA